MKHANILDFEAKPPFAEMLPARGGLWADSRMTASLEPQYFEREIYIMPVSDRDYLRGNHPVYCTCVDCVRERRNRIVRGSHRNRVSFLKSKGIISSPYAWIIGLIVIAVILVLIFA